MGLIQLYLPMDKQDQEKLILCLVLFGRKILSLTSIIKNLSYAIT